MVLNHVLLSVQEKLSLLLKKWNKHLVITGKISAYIGGLIFSRESQLLNNQYHKIITAPDGSYQTPIDEVRTLEFLVKAIKAKKILEIGTFKGYTSLKLALAAGKSSHVYTCEKDIANALSAQSFWHEHSASSRITLLKGDAVESLTKLVGLGEHFDFIYIDADKKQYLKYFELSLLLAHKGSIIAIDNSLWAGLVAYTNSTYSHARLIRELNAEIFNNPRLFPVIIPAWDGLTLVIS